MNSTTNNLFSLAADIIANTSQSVFLTGKAGTGKTTFLHHIRNTVDKNIIIAAPTGVAAINAGGVTLHSLLQLPFEAFTPDYEGKKKLDYHFKLRKSKIEMIQELELLVIDEVSMLRADMLDAIDYLLRRYRNNQQPFGGVQMLFIGDLFQLPPVVQKQEWDRLRTYYASPFFFHAQALNGNLPLYIELKTVYRQSDECFIAILNRIRNNETTRQDLEILNQQYNPDFKPTNNVGYVTLCTHNYRADQINKSELEGLSAKSYSYKGKIGGDFAENALPTEMDLSLKLGAQIMFVKNDVGEQRRYYNGRLAVVSYISDDKIRVKFEDATEMDLEQETWRNVRYTLDTKTGEIEEEELGYFAQYPVRLAWAITIHKSQGLTFERVIIDAGRAFAAGQVYVALSRCTSLDGVVLYSKITQESIQTDREAIAFAKQEKSEDYLGEILKQEKPNYCAYKLKKAFDWTILVYNLRSLYELASEKKIPKQEESLGLISKMCDKAIEQEEIAKNFKKELDRILYVSRIDMELLSDRIEKAARYFIGDLNENILKPLNLHVEKLKYAARVKLYLKRAEEIRDAVQNFVSKLGAIHYGDVQLTDITIPKVTVEIRPEKKDDNIKLNTKEQSLLLFKQGKSIKEIREIRNLKSEQTIEDHLISFIESGEIKAVDLIKKDKLEQLVIMLKSRSLDAPLKTHKEYLPDEYTYFEIKVAISDLQKNNKL